MTFFLLKCLPSVRFGQVVGAGINLMDGEETWPSRTCSAEYIDTLKFPLSNRNPKSCFLLKRSLEAFLHGTFLRIRAPDKPFIYKNREHHNSCSRKWHHVPCRALNPCSGTLEEPVTNWSSRALRSSSYDSTARQNHFTLLLSGVQCFSRVFDFQSLMSILPRPHTMSWEKHFVLVKHITLCVFLFCVKWMTRPIECK